VTLFGGDSLPLSLEKKNIVESSRDLITCSLKGEASLVKGAVHGGLEKDFSLLKTRSARKIG